MGSNFVTVYVRGHNKGYMKMHYEHYPTHTGAVPKVNPCLLAVFSSTCSLILLFWLGLKLALHFFPRELQVAHTFLYYIINAMFILRKVFLNGNNQLKANKNRNTRTLDCMYDMWLHHITSHSHIRSCKDIS